jgi:hypothetical protein
MPHYSSLPVGGKSKRMIRTACHYPILLQHSFMRNTLSISCEKQAPSTMI